MAKSARSSVSKKNRSRLKSKVFGPVEDARTKRLSEKLAELASQPKVQTTGMDVETTESKPALQSKSLVQTDTDYGYHRHTRYTTVGIERD